MKTENYTNLELSKLLNENMEYKSGVRLTWHMNDKGERSKLYLTRTTGRKSDVSAFNFTDLLHWLKLYGEKMGWETTCDECFKLGFARPKVCPNCYVYAVSRKQHKLLDAYIADNLTIGTNVEKFIREIIK